MLWGVVACRSDDVANGGGSTADSSTGEPAASSSGATTSDSTGASAADTTTTAAPTEMSGTSDTTTESTSSDTRTDDSSSTGDAPAYLDEIVPGPDLLQPRMLPIVLRLNDGTVFVGSGRGSDFERLTTVERFRPEQGDVVPAGDLLLERRDPCAVVLADGRVLVLGDSRRTEIWDPVTEISEEGPELNDVSGAPMCMVDADGVVYLADSWTAGKGYLVERWAPGVDEEFVELPSETQLSYGGGHAGALFGDGGSILLVGGDYLYKGDPPVLPGAPRVYDLASGVFSLVEGWDGSGNILVEDDGNALIYRTDASGFRAYRLDAATHMLHHITPVGATTFSSMIALRTDGVVLLAGGEVFVGQQLEPVDWVALWDPDAETMTPIGGLAEPRRSGAALQLDDGSIALIGGAGVDGPTTTIEIYR